MKKEVGIQWLLLLPGAFAAAALLSRVLLSSAPLSIHADLAQPLPVATTWHDFGRALWSLCFGCLLIGGIPYFKILQRAVRGEQLPGLGFILGAGGLSLLAALFMPVVFSSDVYAYAAYGWMEAHGINPYAHTPVPVSDPLFAAAVWQWSNPLPACVYGPLFVGISKALVVMTAHRGVATQLLALRLLSSVALLACGLLLYGALKGLQVERRLAACAGLLLNPVVIWCAAEGHNDSLMLAVVLAGFVVVRRFGYFAGALVITASALIKASGAAAAVVLALFHWRERSRFAHIAGGIAAGVALTAIAAHPFESGAHNALALHGVYLPQFSAQFLIAQAGRMLFGESIHAVELGIAFAVVGCGALVLRGARLALRGELHGVTYIALGLWFLIPNPYPWYGLWILPAAFLLLQSPASAAIIAASLTIFARYLPDASSATNADVNIIVAMCELGLPAALLLSHLIRRFNTALKTDSTV